MILICQLLDDASRFDWATSVQTAKPASYPPVPLIHEILGLDLVTSRTRHTPTHRERHRAAVTAAWSDKAGPDLALHALRKEEGLAADTDLEKRLKILETAASVLLQDHLFWVYEKYFLAEMEQSAIVVFWWWLSGASAVREALNRAAVLDTVCKDVARRG